MTGTAELQASTILEMAPPWLVRRRVRLTNALAALLVAETIYAGLRPHTVLDWHDGWSLIGVSLTLAGLALRSWAAGILRKTRELITTGPYAVIRNPLYAGSFLIMLGFATLLDDYVVMAAILGPLLALYCVQVLHEERNLARIYGDLWHAYAAKVPRLLPVRRPAIASLAAPWSWRQWMGSREYRALGGVIAGLAVLQIWHL